MKTRAPLIEALLLVSLWALILCLLPSKGGGEVASPPRFAARPGVREVAASPREFSDPNAARRRGPRSPRTIDEVRASGAGIRKLVGKHLTLFTDLPAQPQVDGLPQVFDAAVPQWCDYFEIPVSSVADWRMRGYLMGEREPFIENGLLPSEIPNFPNGYAEGSDLWFFEQPTDYYRRHLLLHEGTHGFMQAWLGGGGPPWYMEGMAELLATHAYQEGELTLGYFPQHRAEVPMLGRIKRIQDYVAEQPPIEIQEILAFGPRAHWANPDAYAWCWAICALLDGHPRYQQPFRQLRHRVRSERFNAEFARLFTDDFWPLQVEWQLFASSLAHGYDLEATAIDFRSGVKLAADQQQSHVDARRGWQNSGWWLQAGQPYELRASGRFQIAAETDAEQEDRRSEVAAPVVWWSEPEGVTLRYHEGHPLGALLAAVVPGEESRDSNRRDEQVTANAAPNLLRAERVGAFRRWTPRESGTLHLRLNDSPGELGDNRGGVDVTIRGI